MRRSYSQGTNKLLIIFNILELFIISNISLFIIFTSDIHIMTICIISKQMKRIILKQLPDCIMRFSVKSYEIFHLMMLVTNDYKFHYLQLLSFLVPPLQISLSTSITTSTMLHKWIKSHSKISVLT